jgi:hypothetical protein
MDQIKSLWRTGGLVLLILGSLMIAGGLFINQHLLMAGGFVVFGAALGIRGLHAIVYGEASIQIGRYRTETRYGWGARVYGVQEGYMGTVIALGGIWEALAPGQILRVVATPFGWSILCVLGAILIAIGSVVSLSGATDWSNSAWSRIPNRVGGVIGLLLAAVVGFLGVVTFVMPNVWTMLLGLVGQSVGR